MSYTAVAFVSRNLLRTGSLAVQGDDQPYTLTSESPFEVTGNSGTVYVPAGNFVNLDQARWPEWCPLVAQA